MEQAAFKALFIGGGEELFHNGFVSSPSPKLSLETSSVT